MTLWAEQEIKQAEKAREVLTAIRQREGELRSRLGATTDKRVLDAWEGLQATALQPSSSSPRRGGARETVAPGSGGASEERAGEATGQEDHEGDEILMEAVKREDVMLCRVFSIGRDTLTNVRDGYGHSPFHLASLRGNKTVLQVLLPGDPEANKLALECCAKRIEPHSFTAADYLRAYHAEGVGAEILEATPIRALQSASSSAVGTEEAEISGSLKQVAHAANLLHATEHLGITGPTEEAPGIDVRVDVRTDRRNGVDIGVRLVHPDPRRASSLGANSLEKAANGMSADPCCTGCSSRLDFVWSAAQFSDEPGQKLDKYAPLDPWTCCLCGKGRGNYGPLRWRCTGCPKEFCRKCADERRQVAVATSFGVGAAACKLPFHLAALTGDVDSFDEIADAFMGGDPVMEPCLRDFRDEDGRTALDLVLKYGAYTYPSESEFSGGGAGTYALVPELLKLDVALTGDTFRPNPLMLAGSPKLLEQMVSALLARQASVPKHQIPPSAVGASQLRTLDLSGMSIVDDDFAASFASALRRCCQHRQHLPEKIVLEKTAISNLGASAIGAALQDGLARMVSPIDLDLSLTPVGDEGAAGLAKGLGALSGLRLFAARVGDAGAAAIAEAVAGAGQLRTLDLRANCLSATGAADLVEALVHAPESELQLRVVTPGSVKLAERGPSLSWRSFVYLKHERAVQQGTDGGRGGGPAVTQRAVLALLANSGGEQLNAKQLRLLAARCDLFWGMAAADVKTKKQ